MLRKVHSHWELTPVSPAPLLCAARAVSALSRLSLGPVLPLLVADLAMSLEAQGRLLGAFSTGYLLTQVAGGSLADTYGARAVVLACLIATAVGLAAAPLATSLAGAGGLAAIFFVLGLLNGPLFPACSVMLRDVPSLSRARSMAIVDAGGTLGGCLATALCPGFAQLFGWRCLYRTLAAVAAFVALVWGLLATDPAPAAPARKEPGKGLAALKIFAFAGPWALFWAHSIFNYANYFLNAWLPSMFVERFRGIDAGSAGVYLVWPELVGTAVRFLAAAFADRHLLQAGRASLHSVRRWASAAAFMLQGLFLTMAVRQEAPLPCALLLVAASASAGLHSCGFKANYLDLTTEHSGALAGVGNTLASVASAAMPVVTSSALLLFPGGWGQLFALLFFLNCTGALVVLLFLSVANLDSAAAGWRAPAAAAEKASSGKTGSG